ncbi:hypothetical protein [Streptomyces sp. NPDC102462]|uniref:hypothetical protein n=1 Tax=Streptomyces sp. NPDC102462 TaxID=3366178 RepID=UPI00380D258A
MNDASRAATEFAESAPARREVVTYLRQGRADGALVVSTHADESLLADAGLPAVPFARPSRPAPLGPVDLAHRAGAASPCLLDEHVRGIRTEATSLVFDPTLVVRQSTWPPVG